MGDGLPSEATTTTTTTKSLQIPGMGADTNSISTGWTDKKHSLYLNSIEASFVNQLHNREHLLRDSPGWLSRVRKHTILSGSSASSMLSGQFKVQRRGCWENLKFERSKRRVDVEDQSRLLSENPWIQHFRSPSIEKRPDILDPKRDSRLHVFSSNKVAKSDLEIESLRLTSMSHGIQATSSNHFLDSSHLYRQDSVGSNTEVSDQNFVEEETGTVESNQVSHKRRVRTISPPPLKDQVVPSGKLSVESNSDENGAFSKKRVGESSSRKPEDTAGVLYFETELVAKE